MTFILIGIILILAVMLFIKKQKELVVILDSSAVTDIRIVEFIDCNLFDKVILPKFIIKELENQKDKKTDIEKLKNNKRVEIINNNYSNLQSENFKILKLAKEKKAKIITKNFELNKMAIVKGVEVINLNDIYESLKPIILPGHSLSVFLVKEGKEQNQAVGYLEDGTTVVVENAKRAIGTRNNVVITSIMQTSTNRLVFAKIEE
ncbi:TRAM domain-containing protein [Elusimicrobiota bacterium]